MQKIFFEGQSKREQSQTRLNSAECSLSSIFYQLVQVALGLRPCLSHSPSADEWGELYAMANKQSLIGVCFAGVQRLQTQRKEPPEMTYFTWMGMAAKIQQRNEVVNRQCVELQAKLAADGVRSCILKGQGVAALYRLHDGSWTTQASQGLSATSFTTGADNDNSHNSSDISMLRQSGDIDVWIDANEEAALRWVKKYQRELDFDYKHVHLDVIEGTSVEVHYRPSTSRVPWYMRRVEQFTREKACWTNAVALGDGTVNVPSLEFNLVFILQHIFGHLFAEEMTLKQYLDYYFVLKQAHVEGADVQEAYRWMQRMGMGSFARATMWLLREVFGMPEEWMICEADADEGRFLLDRVMAKEQKAKKGEHGSVRWHLSVFWAQQSKNLHLLTHYPLEVMFSPLWLVRHFFWKRIWKMKHKELFV